MFWINAENYERFSKLQRMFLRDEGLRLKPYRCPAGKLTIGYGRNLEAKPISNQSADMMLWEDIQEAERAAEKIFGELWSGVSEIRQFAIINMIYNLGAAGFAKFERTIGAMKEGQWEIAAAYALQSKWAEQVGLRATRVARMLADETFDY